MNHDFAVAWATAMTEDTDRLLGMYADKTVVEHRALNDHMTDTISDRNDLRHAYAPFGNDDESNGLGVHTVTIDEYAGDERVGIILWTWEAEHLERFHGMDVPDGKAWADGQTFQVYDADGKIEREETMYNPIPQFKKVGLDIQTPHYWEADFDPSAA